MPLPTIQSLLTRFDLKTATVEGYPRTERHLSDLRGCFYDTRAFEAALAEDDPLVYAVTSVEPGMEDGDLHYGLGMIMPGRIGDEYWLTKGHLHAWRSAAEFYVGLRGAGLMLLEDEATGDSRLVPLTENAVVYVPGFTAHRTINTGDSPLLYLGIYPARAGHDYGSIAAKNFLNVVVDQGGKPLMKTRSPKS